MQIKETPCIIFAGNKNKSTKQLQNKKSGIKVLTQKILYTEWNTKGTCLKIKLFVQSKVKPLVVLIINL